MNKNLYILFYILIVLIALIVILYFVIDTKNDKQKGLAIVGDSENNNPGGVYIIDKKILSYTKTEGNSNYSATKIRYSPLDKNYYYTGKILSSGRPEQILRGKTPTQKLNWAYKYIADDHPILDIYSSVKSKKFLFSKENKLTYATLNEINRGLPGGTAETENKEDGESFALRGTDHACFESNDDESKIVAVGQDTEGKTILYSGNIEGVWKNATVKNSDNNDITINNPKSVKHGNNLWVIVSSDSGDDVNHNNIIYSQNGENWFLANFGDLSVDITFEQVNYYNNMWVAVGAAGTWGSIFYSQDGIDWNPCINSDINSPKFWQDSTVRIGYSVVYSLEDKAWYALGGDSEDNNKRIYTSTDGINWSLLKTLNESPKIPSSAKFIIEF